MLPLRAGHVQRIGFENGEVRPLARFDGADFGLKTQSHRRIQRDGLQCLIAAQRHTGLIRAALPGCAGDVDACSTQWMGRSKRRVAVHSHRNPGLRQRAQRREPFCPDVAQRTRIFIRHVKHVVARRRQARAELTCHLDLLFRKQAAMLDDEAVGRAVIAFAKGKELNVHWVLETHAHAALGGSTPQATRNRERHDTRQQRKHGQQDGARDQVRLRAKGFQSVNERRWRHWIEHPIERKGPIGQLLDFVSGARSMKDIHVAFEHVHATETAPFERDLKIMKVCVAAAPLVGLLGTVTGMLTTFNALSTGSGGDQTMGAIAGGISEALITTETGLVIALPGLFLQYQLTRKHDRYKAFLAHVQTVCTQKLYRQLRRSSAAA